MDSLIEAFFAIDTDASGEISTDELKEYMNKNNYRPEFIKKWLQIFDIDNSGNITLEEYCKVLGIEYKHATLQRRVSLFSIPDNVKVLQSTMNTDQTNVCIKTCFNAKSTGESSKKIVQMIHEQLTNFYGTSWQCFLIKGQHWVYYTHLEGCSLIIQIDEFVFIIFRTLI